MAKSWVANAIPFAVTAQPIPMWVNSGFRMASLCPCVEVIHQLKIADALTGTAHPTFSPMLVQLPGV